MIKCTLKRKSTEEISSERRTREERRLGEHKEHREVNRDVEGHLYIKKLLFLKVPVLRLGTGSEDDEQAIKVNTNICSTQVEIFCLVRTPLL